MKIRYLVGMILIFGLVPSSQAFEIYHEVPENFLQGVPGHLEVLTPFYLDTPDFVRLYIKAKGQGAYQELNFYQHEASWFCDIPAAFMNVDTLEYFISASFGPAGFAALPANNPEEHPYKVPLIKFKSKKRRFEPALVEKAIADYSVTPWNKKPAFRENNFPVLYIPKATQAFVESGYIKIIGNETASAEDLLRSMLYLCLQENGDAITSLKYSLLSAKPEMDKMQGHIELEGIYLRRPPRN